MKTSTPHDIFCIQTITDLSTITTKLQQSCAEEDVPEGLAEVGVEDGVDDGVECRVEVAKPGDEHLQLEGELDSFRGNTWPQNWNFGFSTDCVENLFLFPAFSYWKKNKFCRLF